jgi:hypothetical protein
VKTYDGAKIALQSLADRIRNYPDGSLSPREVITTLPSTGNQVEDDAMFARIDAAITHSILTRAENYMRDNPPPPSRTPFQMSTVGSQVPRAMPDPKVEAANLTNAVLASIAA